MKVMEYMQLLVSLLCQYLLVWEHSATWAAGQNLHLLPDELGSSQVRLAAAH